MIESLMKRNEKLYLESFYFRVFTPLRVKFLSEMRYIFSPYILDLKAKSLFLLQG